MYLRNLTAHLEVHHSLFIIFSNRCSRAPRPNLLSRLEAELGTDVVPLEYLVSAHNVDQVRGNDSSMVRDAWVPELIGLLGFFVVPNGQEGTVILDKFFLSVRPRVQQDRVSSKLTQVDQNFFLQTT